MNKKMFTAILSISLVAIGLGFTFSATEQNIQTTSNGFMPTDPSEFTNQYFTESIHATYTTTDPFEIKELAQHTAIGSVISVEHTTFDNSNLGIDQDGQEIEPQTDFTTYTIQVESTGKTDVNKNIIEIKSQIPTRIGFETGDTMFVMFENHEGEYYISAGPNGFFKIEEDKDGKLQAIGHEITLPERFLEELKR